MEEEKGGVGVKQRRAGEETNFPEKEWEKKKRVSKVWPPMLATTTITLIIIKITNVYKPNSINDIQLMCLK